MHYAVLVLFPNDDVDVDIAMEPFGTDFQVEPHEEEWQCVGAKAYEEAQAEMSGLTQEEIAAGPSMSERAKKSKWYDKPDPKCEDCEGTGRRMTTYNTDAQWDWYEIGGRWNGYIYGPEVKRRMKAYTDEVLKAAAGDERTVRLLFKKPNEYEFWKRLRLEKKLVSNLENNSRPVKELLEDESQIDVSAIVVNGSWYKDDEFGGGAAWKGFVRQKLIENSEKIAVVVDVHF